MDFCIILQADKEVLIVNLKFAAFCFYRSEPDILIIVAHLVGMWVRLAVRIDDTVVVEVVVGSRITSVVTTISIDHLAVLVIVAQSLVYEVPDKSTLIFRIFAHQIPVFLESTHRVTHSMRILTLDQRTWIVVLGISFAAAVTVIHRAEDIGLTVVSGTLILYRSAWIISFDYIIRLFEVRTISGFVTQTPEDDARMILECFYVQFVTLNVCLLVGRILGQGCFAISHTVAFDIRFGHQIQTILVTQVIPSRVIRIVAGTNGIDVQLLHDLDILNHAFYRYNVSSVRINLMSVGTLEQYRFSVDEHLSVLDFHFAETYILRNGLQHLVTVFYGDIQLVEVRSFCGPLLRVLYFPLTSQSSVFIHLGCFALHDFTLIVFQCQFYIIAFGILQIQLDVQSTVSIIVYQIRSDEYIFQMSFRTGIEIYLACDTGKAPEVLIFQIRTVAPAHHLHGDEVLFSRFQVFGQIKFGSYLAVFAVAHEFTVHPHLQV